MNIGTRIGAARRHAGISRAALARAVGVDSRSIYRWEHGAVEPKLAQAEPLARALGVGVEWLVTGEGDVPFDVLPSVDAEELDQTGTGD